MELSSPRFKALTVSMGFSFWFFIISTALGFFSIEVFIIFVVSVFGVFQLLALKVSKVLDVFSIYTTKFFLGALFVSLISIYGIFFKVLRIDLLRLRKQKDTYWLEVEESQANLDFKQY